MIHNVKFSINLELLGLNEHEFTKLNSLLMEKIIDDKLEPLNFEEIDKILHLSKRNFYPNSVEFPRPKNNDDDFSTETTTFEIIA